MRAKALALEVLISEEISPMMQQVSWLRLDITCGWSRVSTFPWILLQYARTEGSILVRPFHISLPQVAMLRSRQGRALLSSVLTSSTNSF